MFYQPSNESIGSSFFENQPVPKSMFDIMFFSSEIQDIFAVEILCHQGACHSLLSKTDCIVLIIDSKSILLSLETKQCK